MRKTKINIVWLKRDLRTLDHEPLLNAENDNLPYLIIYIFDSELLNHPDTSDRHSKFIYASLLDINLKLKKYNKSVNIFFGKSVEIFHSLTEQFEILKVYSYQESGTKLSWIRDKKIKIKFTNNLIYWREFQRDGIIRGIKNRKNWNKKWHLQMHKKIIVNSFKRQSNLELRNDFKIPKDFLKILKKQKKYKFVPNLNLQYE